MLREQQRNRKILKSMAFANMWRVDNVLRLEFGRQMFATLSSEDQCRLLTLKMWEKKYHVSLIFILNVLIPFWKKQMEKTKTRVSTKSLGVTISTLTGKVSEDVLRKAIKDEFPHGENVLAWKATEQETYIKLRNMVVTKYDDVEDFITDYQEACLRARRRNNKVIQSGKYTRRHYANNPWV